MSMSKRNKATPRVPGEAPESEPQTQAQTTDGAENTMGAGLDLDSIGGEAEAVQQGDTIETVEVETGAGAGKNAATESPEVAALRLELAQAKARAEAAEQALVQGGDAGGESDVDEAIALAQSGQARPIAKVRAPVAPAVVSRPDSERPSTAAVNQKPTMAYADAVALHKAGKLDRSVLTEKGWVAVERKGPPENKR
jgi:hypothetical protein